MKKVVVIGSGIAGMSCSVNLAEKGISVLLVSPFPSERSQSVMAAGGINAVVSEPEEGDSVSCHIDDTLKGGCHIAGQNALKGLCESAEGIIDYLESIGTVFTVDKDGHPARRAFGGQSYKRTYYCGSSTGKQIVSSLVMEARRYEARGLIKRRLWSCFYSALIKDGVCYGVILFDESIGRFEAVYADQVVIATGGQNSLFGKTTGSTQCDGYTVGKLFMQGAELKNLEFIQYHPTTLETSQKRMLISEAVRGEGGRLFYMDGGEKVFFMEEKYGPRGNLMTRDVVSREMSMTGKNVFLDISFLGEKEIDRRIPEMRELCLKYRNIDIAKEPIPVAPSVHFFMGGLAVHLNHETNIKNLFAIGECASMYHGANRLGGNSLLAAIHSARVAAGEIASRGLNTDASTSSGDMRGETEKRVRETIKEFFSAEVEKAEAELKEKASPDSPFPAMYIRDLLAETMQKDLGIVRDEEALDEGISSVDYYLSIADKIFYDSSVMIYDIYSLKGILTLARAVLTCAKERRESRGAHYRIDCPDTLNEYAYSTIISYDGGNYTVRFDREQEYES